MYTLTMLGLSASFTLTSVTIDVPMSDVAGRESAGPEAPTDAAAVPAAAPAVNARTRMMAATKAFMSTMKKKAAANKAQEVITRKRSPPLR